MKKILALILALSMVCCLFAGCGSTPSEEPAPAPAPAPEAKEEAPVAAEPEAPAEEKLVIAGIVFKDEYTMKMVQ